MSSSVASRNPLAPVGSLYKGSTLPLKMPALIPRKKRSSPQNPIPIPETPILPKPPDLEGLSPAIPERRILSDGDHRSFLESSSYSLILAFVFSLSESCVDMKTSSLSSSNQSETIVKIHDALASISSLVDNNPPAEQGNSRFGNPAFSNFIDDLVANLAHYHDDIGMLGNPWSHEVSVYLEHAFGSRTRIDYGSGHELNFIMWLLCLNRVSLLPESTFPAITLLIFPQYIHLLRKIQSTYYLEPAGSHGVWGLDDYHFLPFLFGASQLLHHAYIRPLAIHNDIILEEEGDHYMYLDMVRWTMATKTVRGLKWTQPMLDDISGAKDWEKVEQGMRRMFVKEVLGKLPVMQHFMFGTLIPGAPGMNHKEDLANKEGNITQGDLQSHGNEVGHVHRDSVWGDCCGIKIPSTVAASQEARKTGGSSSLRRVPFD